MRKSFFGINKLVVVIGKFAHLLLFQKNAAPDIAALQIGHSLLFGRLCVSLITGDLQSNRTAVTDRRSRLRSFIGFEVGS